MQLRWCHIELTKYSHGEVIQQQSHMQLGEMTHIHIKELLGRPLLAVTYAVNGAHPLQGNDIPVHTFRDDAGAVQPRV